MVNVTLFPVCFEYIEKQYVAIKIDQILFEMADLFSRERGVRTYSHVRQLHMAGYARPLTGTVFTKCSDMVL